MAEPLEGLYELQKNDMKQAAANLADAFLDDPVWSALFDEAEMLNGTLYLETETGRNVAMYERFGFEVIRRITLPVVDLPMWEMVRSNHAS